MVLFKMTNILNNTELAKETKLSSDFGKDKGTSLSEIHTHKQPGNQLNTGTPVFH